MTARRLVVFAVGCAVLVAVTGTWLVPSGVPRGTEYFAPQVYAEATKRGTITLKQFDIFAETMSGGEDFGYLIARQVWLLAGGDGAPATIAGLHNMVAVVCALAFATAAALVLNSLAAGWAALSLALMLRHALRGLLFGGLDNRTVIVVLPFAVALLMVVAGRATRRLPAPAAILAMLGVGGVLGAADLTRHAEGLLASVALGLACLLVPVPRGRRASAVALLVVGSTAVSYAVPMGVRLFNDVRTGQRQGALAYLQPARMGAHSPWHTLQIGLGRYPNPEGLQYNDLIGVVAAQQRFPEVAAQHGPYDAARAYYFWYVRTHPLAWAGGLARGLFEVVWFVPYATSVGALPWALGYLPAKPGVVPALLVDPRDEPPDRTAYPHLFDTGYRSLLTLRWRYLQLTLVEWATFLAALVVLPLALARAHRAGEEEVRRLLVAMLGYLALGSVARALIPVYGQALVVAFWSTAILGGLYLATGAVRGSVPRDAGG